MVITSASGYVLFYFLFPCVAFGFPSLVGLPSVSFGLYYDLTYELEEEEEEEEEEKRQASLEIHRPILLLSNLSCLITLNVTTVMVLLSLRLLQNQTRLRALTQIFGNSGTYPQLYIPLHKCLLSSIKT